jgi:beta-lactam-binding protein with PASTA domain
MLELLKNKKLYLHLGYISVSGIVLLMITIFSLKSFTRHGESISVPNFTGLFYSELENQPEYDKFVFTINDSIYDPTKERGSIVEQDPMPEALVKEGRHVYLTVISMNPEMIKMPNLVDLSYRNASSIVETYGLIIKKLNYVPDIAKNAIVAQRYRGKPIAPGSLILKGSGIELDLGLGNDKSLVNVPMLIGLTRREAIKILHLSSLNLGEEHFEIGDDTSSVRIYRQSPNYSITPNVNMGQAIDFWYKSNKNFDFEQYLNTLKSNPEGATSEEPDLPTNP